MSKLAKGQAARIRTFAKHVIFESNHILAVNKPAGMVGADRLEDSQPMVNREADRDLLAHYKEYIKYTYNKPGDVYLYPVNILDKASSGVMVFARNGKATNRLLHSFQGWGHTKQYLCIVDGDLSGRGEVLGKSSYAEHWKKLRGDSERSDKEGTKDNRKRKRDSVLKWEALTQCFDDEQQIKTLIAVKTSGSRKHQVRRQLAEMQYPIYGDTLYGSKSRDKFRDAQLDGCICLHAGQLQINAPTGNRERLFLEAPVPSFWRRLLPQLVIPIEPKQSYYSEVGEFELEDLQITEEKSNYKERRIYKREPLSGRAARRQARNPHKRPTRDN